MRNYDRTSRGHEPIPPVTDYRKMAFERCEVAGPPLKVFKSVNLGHGTSGRIHGGVTARKSVARVGSSRQRGDAKSCSVFISFKLSEVFISSRVFRGN